MQTPRALFYTCLMTAVLPPGIATGRSLPSSWYGFIENKGQIVDQDGRPNREVLYLLVTPAMKIQLRSDGFSYEVLRMTELPPEAKTAGTHPDFRTDFYRVDVRLQNISGNVQVIAEEPYGDHINYFTWGLPEGGVTGVRHYRRVVYNNIYPYIDLEFVAEDACARNGTVQVKYNYIVHPQGDPGMIRMRFEGAGELKLLDESSLLIGTSLGDLVDNIPYSYQPGAGSARTEQQVRVRYIQEGNDFLLSAGDYDRNRTLVIDPVPNRLWGTYYGGTGMEWAYGVETDASENVIFTGYTASSTNIATGGTHQGSYGGGSYDIFVAKLNPNGGRIWGTYFGGSGADYSRSVCDIDASGNIAVGGYSSSTGSIATGGVYQTSLAGGTWDAVCAVFNSSGGRVWASYYGGAGSDYGYSTAFDGAGAVYLACHVSSTSTSGIASPGAFQTAPGGSDDCALVKFNAATGARIWGTYYGDSGSSLAFGVATDASNNVIMAGRANNSATPVFGTTAAHQGSHGGGTNDAFIVKFNSAGVRQWGTYYGGPGEEEGLAVETDASGNIMATGYTGSSSGISTNNSYNGGNDVFVVKLDPSGTRLWGNYYGGTGGDYGNGITTDLTGNVYVAGQTGSSSGIATAGAHQSVMDATGDAFLAGFTASGGLMWGTYYGGSNTTFGDNSYDVEIDASGSILYAGASGSTNNISYATGTQLSIGGTRDAFIVKFAAVLPVGILSFTGKGIGQASLLEWTVSGEAGIVHYAVERSEDGMHYESIGTVDAQGYALQAAYLFEDVTPPAGIAYYRLAVIDHDGIKKLSEVIKIYNTFELRLEILGIRLLPGEAVVRFLSPARTAAAYELTDISGKTVIAGMLFGIREGLNEARIAMEPLSKGVYSFTLQGKEKAAACRTAVY